MCPGQVAWKGLDFLISSLLRQRERGRRGCKIPRKGAGRRSHGDTALCGFGCGWGTAEHPRGGLLSPSHGSSRGGLPLLIPKEPKRLRGPLPASRSLRLPVAGPFPHSPGSISLGAERDPEASPSARPAGPHDPQSQRGRRFPQL